MSKRKEIAESLRPGDRVKVTMRSPWAPPWLPEYTVEGVVYDDEYGHYVGSMLIYSPGYGVCTDVISIEVLQYEAVMPPSEELRGQLQLRYQEELKKNHQWMNELEVIRKEQGDE